MAAPRREPTIGSFDLGYSPPVSRVADSGDPLDSPRKPWIAFLLTFFFYTAGFQYVGRFAWGVGLIVGLFAALAALGQSGLAQSVGGALSTFAVVIVWALAIYALPLVLAWRASKHYRLKWYNRWYWYVLLNLLVIVPLVAFAMNKEQYLGYVTYRVPSGSMLPTIGIGDYVVADTRRATLDALRPGDIVAFEHGEQTWLKRIVAGPGQHVQIDAAGIKVDGKLQSREHTQGQDLLEPKWMQFPDVKLGADEFYLLSDNRGNGIDSRMEGPVRRERMQAKVTTIFYSADSGRVGRVE